jgi:hypothetical protein
LNARIIRVEVSSLKDDTFYGNIVAEMNGHTLNVDARPSDALNLAVRAHVPILVDRTVMDAAGITPEEDIQEQKQIEDTAPPLPQEPSEESEKRLSVFEDFLEQLDLEGGDGEDGDEGNGREDEEKD